MSSENGEPRNVLRDVADLRTQFQCEYRFHLKQALGDMPHPGGITGTWLHEKRTLRPTRKRLRQHTGPVIILLLAVSAILLCLVGWSIWI